MHTLGNVFSNQCLLEMTLPFVWELISDPTNLEMKTNRHASYKLSFPESQNNLNMDLLHKSLELFSW